MLPTTEEYFDALTVHSEDTVYSQKYMSLHNKIFIIGNPLW